MKAIIKSPDKAAELNAGPFVHPMRFGVGDKYYVKKEHRCKHVVGLGSSVSVETEAEGGTWQLLMYSDYLKTGQEYVDGVTIEWCPFCGRKLEMGRVWDLKKQIEIASERVKEWPVGT